MLFPFIARYRPFGVLILTLKEMLGNVTTFSIILIVITIAFQLTVIGLDGANQFTYDVGSPYHAQGSAWVVWWAFFGEYEYTDYNWLVSIVVWCYSFTASIILVNLLVAMLTSTFEKLQRHAETVCLAHSRRNRPHSALANFGLTSALSRRVGVLLQRVAHRLQPAPLLHRSSAGVQCAIYTVALRQPLLQKLLRSSASPLRARPQRQRPRRINPPGAQSAWGVHFAPLHD